MTQSLQRLFFCLLLPLVSLEAQAAERSPIGHLQKCVERLRWLITEASKNRFGLRHIQTQRYVIYRGPSVWTLGKKVTRKEVSDLAIAIAEDLISFELSRSDQAKMRQSEMGRMIEALGYSLSDAREAEIQLKMDELRRTLREIPVGDDHYIRSFEPSTKIEHNDLRLVDLNNFLGMKILKRLFLRQLTDGKFQILVYDDREPNSPKPSSVFGQIQQKILRWRSPWRKARRPDYRYPDRYLIVQDSLSEMSIDGLLQKIEESLGALPLAEGESREIWKRRLFFNLNYNFPLASEWSFNLTRRDEKVVDYDKLTKWASAQGILINRQSLVRYLTDERKILKIAAEELAKTFEDAGSVSELNAYFSVFLFDGALEIRVGLGIKPADPGLISRLESGKGTNVKFKPKLEIRIQPDLTLPESKMPDQRDLDDLVRALAKFRQSER